MTAIADRYNSANTFADILAIGKAICLEKNITAVDISSLEKAATLDDFRTAMVAIKACMENRGYKLSMVEAYQIMDLAIQKNREFKLPRDEMGKIANELFDTVEALANPKDEFFPRVLMLIISPLSFVFFKNAPSRKKCAVIERVSCSR